jgi:DNA-binding transcriptional MerR regulator
MTGSEDTATDQRLLSLDELAEQLGMSVRNVRFYTSRGLVPPPIRRGRSGFYAPDHVARLELVRALQGHGFTLAAIERYVARIPAVRTWLLARLRFCFFLALMRVFLLLRRHHRSAPLTHEISPMRRRRQQYSMFYKLLTISLA